MATGPGKYDAECARILVENGATLVLVAVLGGEKGSSFSVNTIDPELAGKLPAILREIANQIEGGDN